MKVSLLKSPQGKREMISAFGGYNHNLRPAENEFYDMVNMTGKNYPLAGSRRQRGRFQFGVTTTGVEYTVYGMTSADVLINEVMRENCMILCWGFNEQVTYSRYGSEGSRIIETGIIYYTKEVGETGYVYVEVENPVATDPEGDEVYYYTAGTFTPEPLVYAYYEDGGVIKSEYLAYYSDSRSLTVGQKQLIINAGKLYLFPDGAYYDLMHTGIDQSVQFLSTSFVQKLGQPTTDWRTKYEIYFTPCDATGTTLTYATSQPSSPADGAYWMNDGALYQWSASQSTWAAVSTTYTAVSIAKLYYAVGGSSFTLSSWVDFTRGFNAGDAVSISGLPNTAYNSSFVIKDILKPTISSLVKPVMIINALLNTYSNYQADITVTISNAVPEMDYVIAHGNRLWGCRYGLDNQGNTVNEIYASALGDAKNWRLYEGTSQDSWTASIGPDGVFTGAAVYNGYPTFFKEDCIIRVYGDYPSDYGTSVQEYRGVKKGSGGSLAIVNDVLYYQTHSGIVAYTGSMPVNIDAALGNVVYSGGVSGTIGNLYYISMKNPAGESNLFVYDTQNGLWHREDDTEVLFFCKVFNDLVFITTEANDFPICWTVNGTIVPNTLEAPYIITNSGLEDTVEWSCDTGNMGYSLPDYKYISKLQLRLQLPLGSTVKIWIQYDSSGVWEYQTTLTGTGLWTFMVSVVPHRCDHMAIRLSGEGNVKIYGMTRVTESVSGVRG